MIRSPSIGLDIVYHDYVYSRLGAPLQAGGDIAPTGSGYGRGGSGGERAGTEHDAVSV